MRRLDANVRRAALRTVFAAALAGVFLFAAGCGADGPSKVVATYEGGGKVTRGELDKFIAVQTFLQPMYALLRDDPEFQNAMLNEYVGLTVLGGRADEAARKEADQKVKERMKEFDKIVDQYTELKQKIKEQRLSNEDFRRFFELQFLAAAHVGQGVAEEDVRKRYDEEIARDPHAFDTATVRHILVAFRDADGNERTRAPVRSR